MNVGLLAGSGVVAHHIHILYLRGITVWSHTILCVCVCVCVCSRAQVQGGSILVSMQRLNGTTLGALFGHFVVSELLVKCVFVSLSLSLSLCLSLSLSVCLCVCVCVCVCVGRSDGPGRKSLVQLYAFFE